MSLSHPPTQNAYTEREREGERGRERERERERMKARLQRERTRSTCTGELSTRFEELDLVRCVLLQPAGKRYLLKAVRILTNKKNKTTRKNDQDRFIGLYSARVFSMNGCQRGGGKSTVIANSCSKQNNNTEVKYSWFQRHRQICCGVQVTT